MTFLMLFLRDPAFFKKIVPACGNFHATGHMVFALNEGLHDCKYGKTKALLGKEKVSFVFH